MGFSKDFSGFREWFKTQGVVQHHEACSKGGIDFCVSRFKGVEQEFHLGICLYCDRPPTLSRPPEEKGLKILMIDYGLSDPESGSFQVICAGTYDFVFGRRYRDSSIMGLRVFEDNTYQFFYLEREAQKKPKRERKLKKRLGGEIIAYFPFKGYGFILSAESREKFFFHMSFIKDPELASSLASYFKGTILPVTFEFEGSDGGKYPRAKRISFGEISGLESRDANKTGVEDGCTFIGSSSKVQDG